MSTPYKAPSYPRPQPTRWTVDADDKLFRAVTTGNRELLLTASGVDGIMVGDVLHLVEVDNDGRTGRCCYRLITRCQSRKGPHMPVTVLPGTGQCTSCPDV